MPGQLAVVDGKRRDARARDNARHQPAVRVQSADDKCPAMQKEHGTV
ncbi:Uncharacterised protein [Mycobacteroides abscessus subsp. massiliense]|nr:Uncharacterised protein [Mycobacteroides abscessus subsp. massiliense]